MPGLDKSRPCLVYGQTDDAGIAGATKLVNAGFSAGIPAEWPLRLLDNCGLPGRIFFLVPVFPNYGRKVAITAMSINLHELSLYMYDTKEMENASFAAGCFWGIEAAFRQIQGVVDTVVGYTGGSVPEPDYTKVCSGRTGHAEAVGILFDRREMSFEKLLDTFWSIHDPTQVNGQGPDIGSSYRSAIFYHSPEQKEQAEASKARLTASEKYRGKTIATDIVPATRFWKAEEYHQQYYVKGDRGYCASKKCWD